MLCQQHDSNFSDRDSRLSLRERTFFRGAKDDREDPPPAMFTNRIREFAQLLMSAPQDEPQAELPQTPSSAFVLLPMTAVPAIFGFAPVVCNAALYQNAYQQARESVNRYWF